ncbi:MAG TPA: hypothetical protein VGE56_02185 [Rhodocyclaceae bacterium]
MRDNRISAVLSPEDVEAILAALALIRGKLPFLLTLSPDERRAMPKMADKSIGFDEKCRTYMVTHPEFIPGFIDIAEVNKDRELRRQLQRFIPDLFTLADNVDDTLRVTCSENWQADLAYYNSVREASRRGRIGATPIYDDLQKRFPGAPTKQQREAKQAEALKALEAAEEGQTVH